MATINVYAANPTASDITVDAHTVKAGQVTKLALDNTTTDAETLIADGVVLASADKSTTTNANTQLVEKGATLLLALARAVASAGSDAFGQAGL